VAIRIFLIRCNEISVVPATLTGLLTPTVIQLRANQRDLFSNTRRQRDAAVTQTDWTKRYIGFCKFIFVDKVI